jgi:GTPase SAR1 family protein
VSRSGDTLSRSDMVSGRVMDARQDLPRIARDIKFRVLIIGRANAGKTSILQRVCDTTEDPEIYRRDPQGHSERVRSRF